MNFLAAAILAAAPPGLALADKKSVTGRRALVLISQGAEAMRGHESFGAIRQPEKTSLRRRGDAWAKRVGERIARAVGDRLPQANGEFAVFGVEDANAFALPGDKVGV